MLKKLSAIQLNKALLNFLFVFALFILIVLSVLSYSQLKGLMKANAWVTHTYEVIGKIDISLYSLAEIESQQRAYLISNNKDFLKAIRYTEENLHNSLKAAQILTKDNVKQKARMQRYVDLIKERLILLNRVIAYKEKQQLNTAEGLALFQHGTELSSQAKGLGQEIKAVEEILLSERNHLTLLSAHKSSLFLIIGGLLSSIFLIIAFALANIELVNRKRIEGKNQQAKIHLRQIIESTTDMIAALDGKDRFEIFNEAYQRGFKRLFGKSLTVGMNIEEALSHLPQNKHLLVQAWKKSLRSNEQTQNLEFQYEDKKMIYELQALEIKNDINESQGLVHTIRDISNRVQEHAKLQESYKKLSEGMKELELKNQQITLLVDMSDIMLAANSQEELSKIMSKYAEDLLSFSSGDLFIMHPSKNYLEKAATWGKPHQQELIMTPDQCWAIRLGRLHQVKKTGEGLLCEHVKRDAKMPTYLCVPLMAQNDIYGLIYIEIMHDAFVLNEESRLIITAFSELTALALANVRLRENLRYQSIRDPLTGLYNRRYLEDALFKQIHQAERSKFSFSLLMLDVDHFKKINDSYGHDAGDVALREIGKALESSIRQGDIAARYGGEEFLLMLHNADAEKAKKRADQLRIAVSKLPIKYGAQPVNPITVSIGIASFPADSKNKDELIELADKALYAAKNRGRNRTIVYGQIAKSHQDDKPTRDEKDPL